MVTGQLTYIDVDFIQPVGAYMNFINGGVSSSGYCNAKPALVFTTAYGSSGQRYASTRDLDLSGASVGKAFLQFDLVMGCGSSFAFSWYNVQLQYSSNAGQSWSLVKSLCGITTSSTCTASNRGPSTSYSWSQFKTWQRVTIQLTSAMLVSRVRFRWVQTSFSSSTDWALRNIFVGGNCPSGCNNNGNCTSVGTCNCDSGFGGSSCTPTSTSKLAKSLHESFESTTIDSTKWLQVVGGYVGTGCSRLAAGKTLYFSSGGTRMVVTKDLDLSDGT